MKRFNTAGPCDPARHYMLLPEDRLPQLGQLIAEGGYFVVHAPRQSGKTTLFREAAQRLTREGRYTALHASLEAAQSAGDDIERGMRAVIDAILVGAGRDLPPELQPAGAEEFSSQSAEVWLWQWLGAWARRSPRPVVLFLDEIDSLSGETLLSVLRQLRSGFPGRPQDFPASVALIGLRDVRDYKVTPSGEGSRLGTSSPFNIKVESLTLRNFTAAEVAALLRQHSAATGQVWSAEALQRVYELTRGQPWLVNALARQLVTVEVPDPAQTIEAKAVDDAKEALILRRDTHIDSLVDRLREPRVRRVIEPMLAGIFPSDEIYDDDVLFVKDLGLVAAGEAGLEIANPIYREIVPRALTQVTESLLPLARSTYLDSNGRLAFEKLLEDFAAFWREHGETLLRSQPYAEVAAQLVFMAYLQKIVNGSAPHGRPTIDREYAVGRGRIDLNIRWPLPAGEVQRFAIELKVWREGRADPVEKGLEQLGDYLRRLSLAEGTLIVFDQRTEEKRQSRHEILEREGRRLQVYVL